MFRPHRLHAATELMDDAKDVRVLDRTLRDLAAVNRWLGGTRAIRIAILPWLRAKEPLSVLDVGCGGGDIVRAIDRSARYHGARAAIVGVDANARIATLARANLAGASTIRIACASAFALPFRNEAFDVTTMSLTLHHFAATEAARVMHEIVRVTSGAVIVNELERSWLNYAGARLLAGTVWRNSPYTRHDGPISVLRAFTKDELRNAMEDELLEPAHVRRLFFYRLVGVARRKPTPGDADRMRS